MKPYKPDWWDEKITRLGGRNIKGEPNLRTVWSPDEKRWDGKYKYPTPDNYLKPMKCWVLEVWMPPEFFSPESQWKTDLCGPFPRQGYYGMKTPLMTGDGQILPLTDATFESIQRKQLLDIQWNKMNAKDRLEWLETQQQERELQQQDAATKEMHELFDDYYGKEEQENNADNRVFSFPEKYRPNASGILMPIKN